MVAGTPTQALDHLHFAHRAGDEDERQQRPDLTDDRQCREPIELRQPMVGQHQVRFEVRQRRHEFVTPFDPERLKRQPTGAQGALVQFGVDRVVLQHQNAQGLTHTRASSFRADLGRHCEATH